MRRILLARHGQTTANAAGRFQGNLDYPLTEKGYKQAQQLARALAYWQPGKIYTSDLQRSRETARPAAEALGLALTVSPLFREYSWGLLEGLTWQEIKERHPSLFYRLQKDWRGTFIPGQENMKSFRRRLQKGLALLLAENNPETVVLIGHGRYLNALLVEFLNLDFAGPWPFSFAPAAITVLEYDAGRRRLICFNERSHLRGEKND
ncbi:MAG: histidine phosphatase family protein [Firmicutes bacterium]|nr:histidine phosphatase family protein [Bacillota bacterium]